LKRVAEGIRLVRDGHAAHGLESELNGLFERWGLLELKAHAFFAQINELPPIVLAKKHQHDPIERFPRAGTPLVGFPIVFMSCR
jgi:hypothetical protein